MLPQNLWAELIQRPKITVETRIGFQLDPNKWQMLNFINVNYYPVRLYITKVRIII